MFGTHDVPSPRDTSTPSAVFSNEKPSAAMASRTAVREPGTRTGQLKKTESNFTQHILLTGSGDPIQNLLTRHLDRRRKPTVRDALRRRRERHDIARQVNGQVSGGEELRDAVSADGSGLRVDDVVIEDNLCDGRHVAPRKNGYGL